MNPTRIAFILLAFFALSGFSSQPLDERKAQETMPQSADPTWKLLGTTKITVNEKKGLYNAQIPASVKALSGKEITVNGFMLPLESTNKFRHFLLSKRTPTCPFCPPGEPNEVIDVWMDKAIPYSEELVNIKGNFTLMNDHEMGLFFKLTGAKQL